LLLHNFINYIIYMPISTTQSGLKKKDLKKKAPKAKAKPSLKQENKTYIKYMLPIEKAKATAKPRTVRAVRGARPARAQTKKPSTKQIVNIYTSSGQDLPFRTDFRQQLLQQPIQGQVPQFAPVFNIQQPIPPSVMKVEEKKPSVEITEPKPKRTYTKKPVVVGIPVSSGYETERPMMSRQSSGYMTEAEDLPILSTTAKGEFIEPTGTAFLQKQRREMQKLEEEMRRQPSSGEYFVGTERPIVAEVPKAKRGRPAGSKNKPKESPFAQPPPPGQQEIMKFFSKTGGESSNIGGGAELNII